MKKIQKSNKLSNVCYDIRGPIMDRARQMEEEGHKIIKLNIGNLAVFGFDAPEEIQQDMIRNLPTSAGYSDSKGIFGARKAVMHETKKQGIKGVTLDDIYLGNGASVCATTQHQSRATTMGFSALDGLMMGTRSGALDPGVLLYLMEQGWGHDQIQKLLYKQSGLLGVSGESADMRTLRASQTEAARFATDLFAHRVVREVGALSACIGGLDVLAFTGGIGEHDAVLRQQVGDALAYLGVQVDAARNAKATGDQAVSIQADNSAIEVWVVPTDEGRVAAQDALALL